MGIKRRLGINSLFNAVGQFWMTGVSLLLTPIIIHKLGNEIFGYWVIICVISGYYLLIDVGIGVSLVKFYSECNARGDNEGFNRILNTGFTFNLIVSMLFGIFLILSPQIMHIFKVPEKFYKEVFIALCVYLGAGIIGNQFGTFNAVIAGLQRYDIINKIQLALSIPYALATLFVLHFNMGIIGLAVVNGLWIICQAALNIIYAYKLKQGLVFRPLQFHKPTFKMLFSYGIRIKVSNLSDMINFQLDNLLLGAMLGPLKVTIYEIAAKITRFARSLSLWLLPAIVPASSELAAVDDYSRIQLLHEKGSKYLFALVMLTAVFTISASDLLIFTWLGPGYSQSASIAKVLLIGYTANVMTGIGSMIMRGIGKPQYEMRSKLVTIVLNVSLSFLLILKYGIWGAVVGTTLAMVIGSSYFFYLYHSHMAMSFRGAFTGVLIKPVLSSLVASLAVLTLQWTLTYDSRVVAGVILIIDILLFGSVYILFLYFFRFFDNEEIAFAKDFKSHLFNKAFSWASYKVK